ncbi:transferase hexapeptide (six repeat-containing protein) [Rhizobium mongolense subsp. loessense]|uniref:Transferase hexapeptide (Six repeat-containing protein) n=1 Tax=Rhizobium mongolense subsp. loessense TaxID=158890 RepID=A0A1G4SBZ3_9HYPH|nr:hypothetical protein [Rhizobium mongolense]SCW66713.1 transferase hexapeptide (six repeat-containing protein) [Rhizobium mongolense subsp. loessense]
MLFWSRSRALSLFAKRNRVDGAPKAINGNLNIRFAEGGNSVLFEDDILVSNLDIEMTGTGNVLSVGRGSILGGKIALSDAATIIIGVETTLAGTCMLSAAEGRRILIGNNCHLFSATVRTSDVRPVFDSSRNRRLNEPEDVRLGNHVLVSHEAYIARGVEIADGAVIGSRAVVTLSVRENCAVAGNPAVVVRDNVQWK